MFILRFKLFKAIFLSSKWTGLIARPPPPCYDKILTFYRHPLEGSTLPEMKMKPAVVLHKCIKHCVEQKRHKMSISSQQKRRKINNWGCPLPTVHIAQVASKSTHWFVLGKMQSRRIWRYQIPVEQCSRSSLTFCLLYWSILFVTQVFEKDKCASSPPFCLFQSTFGSPSALASSELFILENVDRRRRKNMVYMGESNTSNLVWRCGCSSTL